MRALAALLAATWFLFAGPAQAAMFDARAQLAAGNAAGARDTLIALLDDDPGQAQARIVLAETLIALGDGVGAEAELRRGVQGGFPAQQARHLLGSAVLLQGEPRRALDMLDAGPVAPDKMAYAGRVAGNAHLALGNIDRARWAFDIAIKGDGKNPALWVDVARFRGANADTAGARDAVDYAIELDSNQADALAFKANLVRMQAGLAPSLTWYEQALAVNPDHVEALIDYAATLGDMGRYRDMLVAVRKAAKLAPRDPRPFLMQAVLAARAGDYVLARSLLQRTRGALDDVPAFMLVSAVVEYELEGWTVAADQAEALLRVQPNNMVARRILAAANWSSGDVDSAADALAPIVSRPDADSWSLQMAARVAADRGRDSAARLFMARAVALAPGNAIPFASADRYGVAAGNAARDPLNPLVVIPAIRAQLASGDGGTAMTAALRLQDANRGVADAHMMVGDVAMAMQNWPAAVRAYREARRISASETVGLRLANAQHWSGDPAGAGATVVQLLEANPSGLSANRIAGHLYMDIGRWDDAIRYFERVRVRGGNRDLVLLRELARAWMAKGNAREAGRYAELAYRLQPASLDATTQYADILATLGAVGDARDLYEKAAAMDPRSKEWPRRLAALPR
ncbi:MAG: hypothetical protein RLZZ58_688 [Pseudomonadota bacterium]